VRKHARLIRRGGSTDKERRGPPSRGEGRHREERTGGALNLIRRGCTSRLSI
jgi:hypothetical protein